MKKSMKLMSVLLSVAMLFGVATSVPLTATAAQINAEEQMVGAQSGTTGDCTWTLDDNGLLTISGNGNMGNIWFSDIAGHNGIKAVVINNGVKNISGSAFSDCYSLESITIPDSVTSIGDHAFEYCESLESITIPDSVTSIDRYAFSGCTSLKSVTIPNNLTSIDFEVFYECSSLESVTIPDSVTSIDVGAFIYCRGLKSVTIGNCVTSIGGFAFRDCTNLESITIPDSVTDIGEYTFLSCTSLESATIGNSVASIGEYALLNCTSLKSVTIPDSVTSIGTKAFGYETTDGQNYTAVPGFAIHGSAGSAAEAYANDNGFAFVDVSTEATTEPTTAEPTDEFTTEADTTAAETTAEPTTVAPTTAEPETQEPTTEPEALNGPDENGFFYVDGEKQLAYRLCEYEGDWYFVAENNMIAMDQKRYLNASVVEGTEFKAGYYYFDADGKLQNLNGPDENDYFYINNEKQKAYKLCEYKGDWYLVAENNKIARDQKRYLNASVCEGTPFTEGYYYFNADGKYESMNGPKADGYFYINDVKQTAYKLCQYEGDYYFVAEYNKYTKDQRRYLSAANLEGTGYSPGYYYFDSEGKMVVKNGPWSDGYFYNYNVQVKAYKVVEFEGNYYFVAENNKYVTSCTRNITDTMVGDTGIAPGKYEFGADGAMVYRQGPNADGYFYRANQKVKAYELCEYNGYYYLVAENNKYVKSTTRNVQAAWVKDTGVVPGRYEFDADGKMDYKQGPNADGYFYRANQKVMAYELCEYNGDYYLVAENNKYVKNATRNVQAAWVKDTGVVPDIYEFDADGKMNYRQGPNADGYFYRDNQKVKAYKLCEYNGDYYLVAENNKYVKSATRNLQAAWVKDTGIAPGIYEFDADGKMIIPS